jgi:hypothetical protein
MPLPTRAVAKANAAGSNQDTTPGTIASKVLVPSLRPLSKCKSVNKSTETSASTHTRPPESKTPQPQETSPLVIGTMTLQPQGTSPTAMGTDDDVSVKSPGTVKSNLKKSDEELWLQGEGSLLELIASTRKALFERPPPTDKYQTVITMQSRKWVPIKKSGSNTNKDSGTSGRGRKAASFMADTNFATRETALMKKTPAKEAATKANECVVKL